jgi:hypothetical protein
MSAQVLERHTFSVSRAADFLAARALVSQTGHHGFCAAQTLARIPARSCAMS